jgi:hypothetical protein
MPVQSGYNPGTTTCAAMIHDPLRAAGSLQLIAALALFACSGVMNWADPAWFERLIQEDGIVENWTALTLAAASLLCFHLRARHRRSDALRGRTWLFLGLLLAFGALEEISWGQRVFGWESPRWFMEHNAQHETNLHNLRFQGVKLNKWIFGKGLAVVLLVYMGILPLLYPRIARLRASVDRIGLPLARGRLVLVYLAALASIRLVLSLSEDSRAMELGEMIGAAVFVAMLLNPLNPRALPPRRDAVRGGG